MAQNLKTMAKFNLQRIIEDYGLDNDALCVVLFPNLMYPNLAINRVLKGESELSTSQVEALAEFIGVPTRDLFSENWRGFVAEDAVILRCGVYAVYIKPDGVTYFKGGNIIGIESKEIAELPFTEFINHINNYFRENGNN